MQLNPAAIYLNGIGTGSVYDGLDGEKNLKDDSGYKFAFLPASVKKATILKRFDGVAKVMSATFIAPVQNPNSIAETRQAGIKVKIKMVRTPHHDHETYLDSFTTKYFSFPFEDFAGQAVAASDIAAEIVRQINFTDAYSYKNAYTAEVDGGDDTKINITSDHVEVDFDVYNLQGAPKNTIEVETESVAPSLSDSQLKRQFGLGIGWIPGKDVDVTWPGGKKPALITLNLGIADDLVKLPYSLSQNAVHGYATGGAIATIQIWVNEDEEGYSDFVTALATAIPVSLTDITPSA